MSIPTWKDQMLLTPGPLTTSPTVKQAMLRDLGSRDYAFIQTVREIREGLLALAGVGGDYATVLLPGSGTYSVESVFSSCVPRGGKVVVVVNGAYGDRMLKICEMLGITAVVVRFAEDTLPDVEAIAVALQDNPDASMLAIVHCETTTGILNPLEPFGALAKQHGLTFFVDAMSSFGAVPIDFAAAHIDYLVSSANKCVEGVPGFGFVIARREALDQTAGWARSLSLDLLSQLRGLEANGQFRFTPPTHSLLAFRQALRELEAEGGVAGRGERYQRNHAIVLEGMVAMGFVPYLPAEMQGYIITSFLYPDTPTWNFEQFYSLLNARGYTIYPGKVSNADCFRIGNIGRLFESDMRALLLAIGEVSREMHLNLT